jgi:vacuolar-type H+-ATPase subunit C/Vma6
MIKRGDGMGGSKKDPIPEHFTSAEDAGEFWDTHSAVDYWDEMEDVEMEFDLHQRVFLVAVNDRIFYRAKQRAEMEQRSVEEMINILLERELA